MTEQIQTISTGFEQISIDVLDEYPDLLIAIKYMLLRESMKEGTEENLTMQDVTDLLHNEFPSFPTTRSGAYIRIAQWRQDGTLRRANEIVIEPKLEEYRAAIGRVVTAVPEMLDKLVDDVLTGKAKSKTLEHVIYLLESVVKPVLQEQQNPGSLEKSWLAKTKNFSPTTIEED